ncbi:flagellar biosynthetic protein FliO [Chitinivorax sp. B]|uniref:flagellar biosynthetic protein FliO n=1 Tax=Chitinivorax sp. B TaxID=2502235 RepID=UPI0010F64A45|nr:flagellar biosynthetic protein FliO [Chitinivorax sp. B]
MRHLLAACMTTCLLFTTPAGRAVPAESSPAPASQPIPFKRATSGEDDMVMRMIGALVVAGLSALGIALLIRRYGLGITGSLRPSNKRLVLQERLRVSPGTQLLVVRFDEEDLLIAESASGVTILQRHRHPLPNQEEKSVDV